MRTNHGLSVGLGRVGSGQLRSVRVGSVGPSVSVGRDEGCSGRQGEMVMSASALIGNGQRPAIARIVRAVSRESALDRERTRTGNLDHARNGTNTFGHARTLATKSRTKTDKHTRTRASGRWPEVRRVSRPGLREVFLNREIPR